MKVENNMRALPFFFNSSLIYARSNHVYNCTCRKLWKPPRISQSLSFWFYVFWLNGGIFFICISIFVLRGGILGYRWCRALLAKFCVIYVVNSRSKHLFFSESFIFEHILSRLVESDPNLIRVPHCYSVEMVKFLQPIETDTNQDTSVFRRLRPPLEDILGR